MVVGLLRTFASVALRKESVDRNVWIGSAQQALKVALRKESVDRNAIIAQANSKLIGSLSARRAWIEIRLFTRIA